MYKLIVARSDPTSRRGRAGFPDGLGPGYNVLARMKQTRAPFSEPVGVARQDRSNRVQWPR
jgi:hypothetical protein